MTGTGRIAGAQGSVQRRTKRGRVRTVPHQGPGGLEGQGMAHAGTEGEPGSCESTVCIDVMQGGVGTWHMRGIGDHAEISRSPHIDAQGTLYRPVGDRDLTSAIEAHGPDLDEVLVGHGQHDQADSGTGAGSCRACARARGRRPRAPVRSSRTAATRVGASRSGRESITNPRRRCMRTR